MFQNTAIAISTDIYDKLDNVGRVGGIVGMTSLPRAPGDPIAELTRALQEPQLVDLFSLSLA